MFYIEITKAELAATYSEVKIKLLSGLHSFTELREKWKDLSKVPVEQLGFIMLQLAKHEIEANSIPRNIFRKHLLAMGEMAIFDSPSATSSRFEIRTEPLSVRKSMNFNSYNQPEVLDKLMQELIAGVLVEENLKCLALFNNPEIEQIQYTKSENQINARELETIVSAGYQALMRKRFTPRLVLIHPRLLQPMDSSLTDVHNIRIMKSLCVPKDEAYMISAPEYAGIYVFRTDLQIESFRNITTFSTEFAMWEDVGMGLVNPNSILKVIFN